MTISKKRKMLSSNEIAKHSKKLTDIFKDIEQSKEHEGFDFSDSKEHKEEEIEEMERVTKKIGGEKRGN